jgi:hypothetical protein
MMENTALTALDDLVQIGGLDQWTQPLDYVTPSKYTGNCILNAALNCTSPMRISTVR